MIPGILVIEPRSSLFSLNLKEIWQYRDLLEMYIKRDIITFYKQTIPWSDLVLHPTYLYDHCFHVRVWRTGRYSN